MKNTTNEDILVFEPFVRKKFPVLICLFGFSGCGKTLSAIKIAQGMGGKTGFLDTETGRGRVYADDAKGFTYAELTPPFTPERYIAAFRQFEAAGCDNLVLDSGSHEWDGLGGMLDIAEANVTREGKKKTGLGKWSVKSRHKSFMGHMMAGRMNIIICLRAKDKFLQKGDTVVQVDGFVPLQERNFKYDMMIQLPMPEDGEGRFLMDKTKGFKCPGALLEHFKEDKQITSEIGEKISQWIATGEAVDELLRQLKNSATAQAELGADNFRTYWKDLPKEQQLQLRPFVSNFESIAKTADLEKEEEPETLNPGGTNISSLVHSHAAMPNDPKAHLSIAAQTPADALPLRRAEDGDFWSLFDQLAQSVVKCKNMQDYNGFVFDNIQQLASLSKAPDYIVVAWDKTVDAVISLARKVA